MKDRFISQSFLGENSQSIFETTTVGVVGIGGGATIIALPSYEK